MSIRSIVCGHCGQGVSADVVLQKTVTRNVDGIPTHDSVDWLQCPNCRDGSVKTVGGAVYPAAPAGRAVDHLPADVEQAWREGRTAHNVAAYTAAEMMFRKILMHVAVDKTGAEPGARFAEYVDRLASANLIVPALRPVVDQVRHRGNEANHGLPASTEQDSRQTMAITEHLLSVVYELPAMVNPPAPEPPETPAT